MLARTRGSLTCWKHWHWSQLFATRASSLAFMQGRGYRHEHLRPLILELVILRPKAVMLLSMPEGASSRTDKGSKRIYTGLEQPGHYGAQNHPTCSGRNSWSLLAAEAPKPGRSLRYVRDPRGTRKQGSSPENISGCGCRKVANAHVQLATSSEEKDGPTRGNPKRKHLLRPKSVSSLH